MLRSLSDNDERVVEQRKISLAKKSMPSTPQIKNWYETKKNLIKVTSRLDTRDEGLETMINSYSNQKLLKDDGN